MLSANSSRRARRLPAFTLALAIGGGFGVTAPLTLTPGLAPQATAQTCSNPHQKLEGEINWGFKESFLNYIKGPIANGDWSTSGATDNGNSFGFKVSKGYVDNNNKGFVQGSGTVTFTGHHGLLKTVISKPTLKYDGGTDAQLLLEVSSQDPDGNPIRGLDGLVHFADVSLSSPITGSGTYTGRVNITATGGKAMADFYKPGTQLDDITLEVTGTDSCDPLPTIETGGNGGQSGGSTRRNRNLDTGFGGLDALNLLNQYLESGNDAVKNTSTFLDTLNKFAGKESNSNSGGTGGGNSAAAKPGADKPGTNNPGANNTNTAGGNKAPAAGTANGAPAANAAAKPTASGTGGGGATAQKCTAVTDSELAWGVKKSFISYITGSIAKGGFEGDGVEHTGGAFVFTGSDGSVDEDKKVGSVNTSGSLHFYGHGGKLDLTIANPRATFNGNSGQLIADMKSSDVQGNKKDFGTVAIADLAYSSLAVSGNSVKGTAEVFLTAAGADAFAGFYEPGLQLDPLAIDASLGGGADCAGANSTASSASDGTASAASGMAAALAAGKDGGSSSSSKGNNKSKEKGKGKSKKDGKSAGGFNDNKNGDVSFRGKGAGDEDIEEVSSASSTLSPAQLAALAAAFALAAGACLTLTYKRKPLN